MHPIDRELQCMLRGQFLDGWRISEQLEAIGENNITDPSGQKNPEMWLRHNFNRGWFLLQQGKYLEGNQLLESGRFLNVYGSGRLKTNKPIWDQADLTGKTIILSLEGGFGDEIIHVRFAQSLAKKNARVIVAADPKLHSLFSRISGVDQVIQRDQAMERRDQGGDRDIPGTHEGDSVNRVLSRWKEAGFDQLGQHHADLGYRIAKANPDAPRNHWSRSRGSVDP